MNSPTTRSGPAATAPADVLRRIFLDTTFGFLDGLSSTDWVKLQLVSRDREFETYSKGLRTVVNSALVNKHWRAVAVTVLYYDIQVRDWTIQRVEALCDALRAHPSLAANVRRLTLLPARDPQADWDCDLHKVDITKSLSRLQLLWLCRNVTDLRLSEGQVARAEDFLAVLPKCRDIRTFCIERCIHDDGRPAVHFCNLQQLLLFMLEWPSIERVHVLQGAVSDCNLDEYLYSWEGVHPRGDASLCSLRVLKLGHTVLTAGDIDFLSRFATQIEVLEFGLANMIGCAPTRIAEKLVPALKGWQKTLQDLSLLPSEEVVHEWSRWYTEHERGHSDAEDLFPAIAALPMLRRLQIGPALPIAPLVSSFPPALEALHAGLVPEDLRVLICALRGQMGPGLKSLTLKRGVVEYAFDRADVSELREICKLREIQLEE
ncbi:hypothetical protein GLOTRDRAFT_132328 [Gloeophyllum trabeum ATCC 11539]|uniref:F-box domain-containing protein n=1 Tax=Gloeophyllum trabeum (strain ATCC 11539 / FP-39264 / Madison 617) TaxID=670483 RepID=S7RDB6_GLOTA|nr:uncharacterized protein GLOTRDRAFT_132328 [Gloeophyllum trabeum ATCC 11539]EPQ52210.1 hypothetical protein GLOTRDRAFT_132328 [Gloeophyllum trabeum ATCC 11539]